MRDEREKWVDEVMGSLQGMQAAEPPADLFDAIVVRINKPKAQVIPLRQLRWSIAIAAVLLLLNAVAIRSYAVSNNDGFVSVEEFGGSQLVSDFKIYE
jgi:hypothetical protein